MPGPPTRGSTSTSAGAGCSSSARTCSPASPTTSCRWRRSPRRRGSRRRCSTTTSRARRRTSSPRWRRRRTSCSSARRRTRTCRRSSSSRARWTPTCGWIEENAVSYDKMIRNAGAAPEVRALLDRVRDDDRAPDRRRAAPGGARRHRCCARRCAAGSASWTARAWTGSITATWTGRRLHGLLLSTLHRRGPRRRRGPAVYGELTFSRSTTKTSVASGAIAAAPGGP